VDILLYFFFNLCPTWGGWSTPRPGRFTTRERPVTHFTVGWVGSKAGLDGCEISSLHGGSIPAPPSP